MTLNALHPLKHRLVAWTKRHRAELLGVAFVAQILASPLADDDPHAGAVLALILLAIFGDGRKLPGQPQSRLSDLGSLLPSLVLGPDAGSFRRSWSRLFPSGAAAGLGLSCAALFIIFHRFFSVSMVTRAMLAEAFVCYFILAIAFSQLYLLLSRVVDHPFNQQIPVTQSSTFLYFSMDTLSGVGTGVIAPINPYVRLITGFENMIGIFYLAVVVSRLVSATGRETGSSVTNHGRIIVNSAQTA